MHQSVTGRLPAWLSSCLECPSIPQMNTEPTHPSVFKVDVRERGPLAPVMGEAVLLDKSPCPIIVNITMRKRFRDSAMLGLMIHIEGQSLVIDLLKSGGDRMMSHVLISLLQCVSRQGDIAWVDANFRARLWAAVDKGIYCF
jgi:hypothetical protein